MRNRIRRAGLVAYAMSCALDLDVAVHHTGDAIGLCHLGEPANLGGQQKSSEVGHTGDEFYGELVLTSSSVLRGPLPM